MSNQSFIQVPPDGAGKKVFTLEHTINGNQVHGYVNHISDPHNSDQYLSIDARGSASVRFAEGQPILSGFGSVKTTNQRALGVYESSIENYDELFSIQTANGGVSTYQPQASSVVLSVNGTLGSKVTRTTNRYHYYLPGSSNFIAMTIACGDTGKIGNTRRWGAFDDSDGIYFELEGTTLNVVIRSTTSGSVTETKVPQNLWNQDKLDGLGKSGATLDLTKINVWWMDYQWLGAGRARFGIFEPNGSRLVCHAFENAGKFALPYMRTGTLPLRTENLNTAATGSTSELREVCMAIYTEGTYKDYTFWRHSAGLAAHTVTTPDQYIVGIRSVEFINGKHNSIIAYPENFEIYTDQPFELSFWQNVEISGGTWGQIPGLTLEATTGGTPDFTNARRFKSFFFGPGVSRLDLTNYFELNDEGIQRNADGSANNWVVTATPLTASPANIKMNINYKELW